VDSGEKHVTQGESVKVDVGVESETMRSNTRETSRAIYFPLPPPTTSLKGERIIKERSTAAIKQTKEARAANKRNHESNRPQNKKEKKAIRRNCLENTPSLWHQETAYAGESRAKLEKIRPREEKLEFVLKLSGGGRYLKEGKPLQENGYVKKRLFGK